MKLPKQIGEVLYILLIPIIWHYLRQSHRVYVVVCIGDSFIVTQNWLGSHKKWRLPGGGIKPGESVLAAAARELKEELNIDVKNEDFTPINVKFNNFKFLRAEIPKNTKITPKETEISAAEAVKFVDFRGHTLDKSTHMVISSLAGVNEPNLL